MLKVTLSLETMEKALKFAESEYEHFYKRMYSDRESRIDKVYVGKCGEAALAQVLDVEVDYSVEPDRGFDLLLENTYIGELKIAVKTKRAPRRVDLSKWWVHIPHDQYHKILNNSDCLFGCLFNPPTVWIVGWLPMDLIDELKVYHKAGTEITPGFKLPPPDSWGVRMTDLDQNIKGFLRSIGR